LIGKRADGRSQQEPTVDPNNTHIGLENGPQEHNRYRRIRLGYRRRCDSVLPPIELRAWFAAVMSFCLRQPLAGVAHAAPLCVRHRPLADATEVAARSPPCLSPTRRGRRGHSLLAAMAASRSPRPLPPARQDLVKSQLQPCCVCACGLIWGSVGGPRGALPRVVILALASCGVRPWPWSTARCAGTTQMQMLHIVGVCYCSAGYAYTVHMRPNTFSLFKMSHIVKVSLTEPKEQDSRRAQRQPKAIGKRKLSATKETKA
jgi:hypothetical protein